MAVQQVFQRVMRRAVGNYEDGPVGWRTQEVVEDGADSTHDVRIAFASWKWLERVVATHRMGFVRRVAVHLAKVALSSRLSTTIGTPASPKAISAVRRALSRSEQ